MKQIPWSSPSARSCRNRRKGCSFAWEQCKLGDVADRFDNLRVPVTANLRKNGDTPYYGANGIQDFVDSYTHDGEYILVRVVLVEI
ncbi:restriction endonuclease subunit S [Lactobacillus sp.]|uniref:restriction endonuclease subunit S n=1 Tax=Lactobacillus sp. TaxID=1591 RepID=UPI003F088100